MGVKLQGAFSNSTSRVPGPGEYENDRAIEKKSGPKYGFGTSKRYDAAKAKINVPGPGNYEMPNRIGHASGSIKKL